MTTIKENIARVVKEIILTLGKYIKLFFYYTLGILFVQIMLPLLYGHYQILRNDTAGSISFRFETGQQHRPFSIEKSCRYIPYVTFQVGSEEQMEDLLDASAVFFNISIADDDGEELSDSIRIGHNDYSIMSRGRKYTDSSGEVRFRVFDNPRPKRGIYLKRGTYTARVGINNIKENYVPPEGTARFVLSVPARIDCMNASLAFFLSVVTDLYGHASFYYIFFLESLIIDW